MKKIAYLLSILLLTSCETFSEGDERIQNPIFYETMRPISNPYGYKEIIGNTIHFKTVRNDRIVTAHGNCEIVENEETYVTLLCDIFWESPDKGVNYDVYLTYEINEEQNHSIPSCLMLTEYVHKGNIEDYIEKEQYCVTHPDLVLPRAKK